MTIIIYTTTISPHQLPLARELARIIGQKNFRYIYTDAFEMERSSLGWREEHEQWITQSRNGLEDCDLLLADLRDTNLFELRSRKGLKTYYMSERWFKPIPLFCGLILLPGWMRMMVPSYRKMARRITQLIKGDNNFYYLPVGPWAAADMRMLGVDDKKMIPWGYFVAPSASKSKLEKVVAIERSEIAEGLHGQRKDNVLSVLWVGRMLKLKRVDTIIRAVARVIKLKSKGKVEQWRGINLTLVGDGPEKERLMKLAEKVNSTSTSPIITFLPSQPIEKIREIMREHDVYVFSSNGMDGWGAVVNEALEEGMAVIGTYETGASAVLLPESNLYHCGDVKGLVKCLSRYRKINIPYEYTAMGAAERVIAI